MDVFKVKSKIMRVLFVLVLILGGWIAWGFYDLPAQRPSRGFPAASSRYDFGKVLVVYYSLGGNTAEVAGRIRDLTDGTLLEIETEKHYPSGPALYMIAGLELKNRDFPALKKTDVDFSSYDTIFVGAPVWWYTMATPALSFLSKADFKGKTVIPFATYGGNYGDFFVHFASQARNANVREGMGFTFSRTSTPDISSLDQKISAWLEKLNAK